MNRMLLPCLLLVAVGACAEEAVVPQKRDVHVGVSVIDDAFSPADVTIKAGEDVTWVWDGQHQHGIQFFGSPTAEVAPTGHGSIHIRTFEKPGLYIYYCPVHGGESGLNVTGMSGRITVTQ